MRKPFSAILILGLAAASASWLFFSRPPDVADTLGETLADVAEEGTGESLRANAQDDRDGPSRERDVEAVFKQPDDPYAAPPSENGKLEGESYPASFFFVTEEDYVDVASFWSKQNTSRGSEWVDILDGLHRQEDLALNSRDLETLAAAAVVDDPRYSYEPALSADDLLPRCRNAVCKVTIPSRFRVIRQYGAVQPVLGSSLNSYDRTLYTLGFSHHIVRRVPADNTAVHYFLGNGFELPDS